MYGKEIKKILFIRTDRFGEFLLNIPALRALKETFSQAKIVALLNSHVRELAQAVDFIDEVVEWQERRPLSERLRLMNLLKKNNFDVAVISNPNREFNLLTFFAGIPIRVGYDRKSSFLLTHKIPDTKYLGLKHEIEYNLELVSLIGAKTENKDLCLKIEEGLANSLFKGADLGDVQDLVVIHPFTSDAVKAWPPENFKVLAKNIAEALRTKVVIIGGQEERDRSLELFSDLGQDIINMTGRTTLKQLAVLLKKCRLLISGDSGPVHLACCVGTPVIALFRNDIPGKSPTRWGPWGEGNVVIAKPRLSDITVDEVFDRIKLKLNEKNSHC